MIRRATPAEIASDQPKCSRRHGRGLEREMPLLAVIARQMQRAEDDLTALLPAARKVLRDAFRIIERQKPGTETA
ncbi:MAG: hypothetical protein DWQ31_12285 [Planctomycetota bacterium]|nr:MAG: hypothetical protein DWQ31_12285 [Planctomycetota bacterium]REJ96908.1 MAG: hypothetical protein DWQ35_03265 [Planctomycetota bacterium]REK24592.1 MAG: hypothetical protein DWQ42_13450 [Planctomycetota bacterium]REK45978.1 MAG: hypothetical protein DWQ46_07735 [Planctomycetota bacterium]